ncbi:MAG: hypothetical protein ABH877_00765 [bacterium]
MDVRAYKLAAPTEAHSPGSSVAVRLRPLPMAELQIADLQTVNAPPRTGHLRKMAVILSMAIDPPATADELMSAFAPRDLIDLYMQWADAQKVATVRHLGRLREWIRKSVNDHPDVLDDAVAAWQAEDPTVYYGKPLVELTPAQVTWHLLLREAFREFHVEGKRAGGAWLENDYEDRIRWQMIDD